MVRWYNPRLLLRTGFRAAIAKAIGEITDNREVQAALTPIIDDGLAGCYDYRDRDELVIDYVSDLGDGWAATHAIASAVAAPSIDFNGDEVRRAKHSGDGRRSSLPGPLGGILS